MSHVIRGRRVTGGGGGADKFCWDIPGIRKTEYLFWTATNFEKEKETKNDKYDQIKRFVGDLVVGRIGVALFLVDCTKHVI